MYNTCVIKNRNGKCACGCGQDTVLAPSSNASRGITKGDHRLFVTGHNRKGVLGERVVKCCINCDKEFEVLPCKSHRLFCSKRCKTIHSNKTNPSLHKKYFTPEEKRLATVKRASDWNKRNKERRCEITRKYDRLQTVLAQAAGKVYRKANPFHASSTRKAKDGTRFKIPGSHTSSDIKRIYMWQAGYCANPLCVDPMQFGNIPARRPFAIYGFHRDHIVPVSRGGTNDFENIQLLCPPCNTQKGNMTMGEFIDWQHGKRKVR